MTTFKLLTVILPLVLLTLMSVLSFQELKPGDKVTSFLLQWSYALSSEELWFLDKDKEGYMYLNLVNVPALINRCGPCMWCLRASHPPETKKKGFRTVHRIGQTGFDLARRMVGMRVNAHFNRCNGAHFVDYVIYGTTFGKWWDAFYRPVNEDCPLHRDVTTDTDVMAKSFFLEDGRKRKLKWPDPPAAPLAIDAP